MIRIHLLNEPRPPVSPSLAEEIGLNESMLLLQIEFWISIASEKNIIDGQKWTYQSIRDMQEKAFKFWSISTINRTVQSLVQKGLIVEGNYNKEPYDRTRWLRLNYEVLAKLKSITLSGFNEYVKKGAGVETGVFQYDTGGLVHSDTGVSQNEPGVFHSGTTIPDTTPDTTQIQRIYHPPDQSAGQSKNGSEVSAAIKLFENEHGRPLSPMECEMLGDMIDRYRYDLVREATKRAVAQGARAMRYIERILASWEQKGFKTVAEAVAWEEKRDKLKVKSNTQADGEQFRKEEDKQKREEKYAKFYL